MYLMTVAISLPLLCVSLSVSLSPSLQHIVFDYDINYTGSGDLGVALKDPCDLDQVITPDVQRVFLPVESHESGVID